MIRVLIADDQALFREGLRAVLVAKGVDVVGEASDGHEAVALAASLAPDVVLMDLRMPNLDGVAATRRIQSLARPPRVVALTTFDDDAATSIDDASPNFTVTFRPEELLAALDGESADGVWILELEDAFPSADDGVLHNWTLNLTTSPDRTTTRVMR